MGWWEDEEGQSVASSLGDGVSENELNIAIDAFNLAFVSCADITSAIAVDKKKKIVERFIYLAKTHDDAVFQSKLWLALRICSRVAVGMGALHSAESFQILLNSMKHHLEIETLKVLYNTMLTMGDQLHFLFKTSTVLEELLDVLPKLNFEDQSDFMVMLSKCLFVCTALYPETTDNLEHPKKDLDSLLSHITKSPPFIETRMEFECEILKVLLVLCSHWWTKVVDKGIEAIHDDDWVSVQASVQRVGDTVWKILGDAKTPMFPEIVAYATDILSAVPLALTPLFFGVQNSKIEIVELSKLVDVDKKASRIEEVAWDPDEPGQATTRVVYEGKDATQKMSGKSAVLDPTSLPVQQKLDTLVSMLHLMNGYIWETDEEFEERISALAYFIRNICKISRSSRQYLAEKIIPRRHEFANGPEEGDSLSAFLVRKLLSTHKNTPTLIGEMLFMLCNANVGRLIRRVGYGNAAGYLTQRGIIGMGSDENATDSDSGGEGDEDIDPVTGKPFVNKSNEPEPWASEEEKEQSAMELVGMMQRLNELGVIKVGNIDPSNLPKDS